MKSKKGYTYHPVGTIVDYKGVKLVVTETKMNLPKCAGCFFTKFRYWKEYHSNISCCEHGMMCTAYLRKDKKHVVFKKSE